MNDEQQIWQDAQRFMRQFPGFVAICKKIGDIGQIEAWQENEQQKLDALTQEVEKQKWELAAGQKAAEAFAAERQRAIESDRQDRVNRIASAKADADSVAAGIINTANATAASIVADTNNKLKAARAELQQLQDKKAGLAVDSASLEAAIREADAQYTHVTSALSQIKIEYATFMKKVGLP